LRVCERRRRGAEQADSPKRPDPSRVAGGRKGFVPALNGGPATIGPMAGPRRRYTIDEANALVPEVRAVLLQLAVEQRRLDAAHAEMHVRLAADGDPAAAADASRSEAQVSEIGEGIRSLVAHLEELGIQLRDPEMGLVDFPAERDGQPVWLCWRLSDASVAYWHGTDEGYATRRPW